MVSATIEKVTLADGTDVAFGKDDIVVLVGPNNVGKSAFLRAVKDKLVRSSSYSPVVRSISVRREGTIDDVLTWLNTWATKIKGTNSANDTFSALGNGINVHSIQHYWTQTAELGDLTRWFCHMLSANERLGICDPAQSISLTRVAPSHPIHFLQRDDEIEAWVSARFRKAFGADLIVHRNAGQHVPLYVGERPVPEINEDRVSLGYIKKVEALPELHLQGDGMRSFAGVLLATSAAKESILLVDEPEAFLHPPQARLLGNILVQDQARGRQVFIATHSSDILRGILETENPRVRVIRLGRQGNTNTVRLLENAKIRELWSDPLLRYSNILDGLFHEGVVVCEADSDCRFYSAVLDATLDIRGADVRRPDIMFTHCGGKARLPLVINALREVGVPVRAVADFDVLSNEEPLKSIVEALGIGWDTVLSDWKLVKTSVDKKKPDLTSSEIKGQISAILDRVTEQHFPSNAKSAIHNLLKRSSAWAHAKEVGKAFIPPGDEARACERLLRQLKDGGLHVVDVGELEGFVRTEGGHGPKWVNAVLTKDLKTDPELEQARQFVSRFIP